MNRAQAQPRGHRIVELRSIAYHREIAARLTISDIESARRKVEAWLENDGPVHPYWAERWLAFLSQPLDEIVRRLDEDSEEMRDLRQSTPFAGFLGQKKWEEIVHSII